MFNFPIFPQQASTVAWQVDLVFFILTALSVFFIVAVTGCMIFFVIRYQHGSLASRINPPHENTKLEITWSIIPLFMAVVIFLWGTGVYFNMINPPQDALEVYVIGKQWMWKTQHPNGKREVNELHIPVNQPIKLTMTSQDVIHDFFIPAFRVKQDVVPGKYTSLWFEATDTGTFHLFCAEYCGTEHSRMRGTIYVLEESEYQRWLSGDTGNLSLAEAGEQLFEKKGCASCHAAENSGRGPSLIGIYGQKREFEAGDSGIADEDYVRESILQPMAHVVKGYPPIMPAQEGLLSEEDLLKLVEYIKSLSNE